MNDSDRAEARYLAVCEMIEHKRATDGLHGTEGPFTVNLALLLTRADALWADVQHLRAVESYHGFQRGLCRPGRGAEPFTPEDLAGWVPPPATPAPHQAGSAHDA